MSSKSETAKVAPQVNVFLKDTNQPLDQLSLVSFVQTIHPVVIHFGTNEPRTLTNDDQLTKTTK